jgi:probable F420-dependent oxidoreductase
VSHIEAALPFWLDRPDEEALGIARSARDAGLDALWIGEMATFDAFALATAVGAANPGLRLKLGPLPISVRTPVGLAFGAHSVSSLTGCPVDLALGASSPVIVAGWHDRDWMHAAPRMRETIQSLRPILRGERADHDGRFVRAHGFRLRRPLPGTRIGVGVFGPVMTRLAAELADDIVLNRASPQRVAEVRAQVDDHAAAAGRTPPHLTVWITVAVEPGEATLRQVANQLSVYLAPPGYGEMFSELGFAELVARARTGARRAELAAAIPLDMIAQLGAVGNPEQITARFRAYLRAGADTVAVVPTTADDPNGQAALHVAAACELALAKEESAS